MDELDPEHAAAVSAEALDLMKELGIPLVPTNFTVWFVYVLGRSAGLRQTIDVLRSNHRRFDKATNQELYASFLASNTLAHAGQTVPEELSAILLNVRQDLSGAVADNRVHAEGLRAVEASLRPAGDPNLALARLSEQLAAATERASVLEAKLVNACSEVEKLRSDLDQAELRSKTDALTGLANRRALEAFIRAAQIRAMEQGEPLSAFIVDIDNFKTFNDKYGHQLGDQVLKVVSSCVREGVRDRDLASRYGGEELMCVLPGATIDVCRQVAERIRSRIAAAQITKRATGERIGQVTVSVGVAEFLPGESFEALFERCDRAMYRAKQDGRNRTVAL
ncbi:GGDEF domain-containing protein [Bradyrhizobium sp. DOA9]|uniref:GGDEF domain-containing protein n=1 Tax=Bradyrhizobium sp. DOA9 TaxID=1126627 RepID=UPI00178D0527|nr:GGDEF domain-containing protein [Bradyrhizobium sp. DOA9]